MSLQRRNWNEVHPTVMSHLQQLLDNAWVVVAEVMALANVPSEVEELHSGVALGRPPGPQRAVVVLLQAMEQLLSREAPWGDYTDGFWHRLTPHIGWPRVANDQFHAVRAHKST